jgi:hypothetical protein
MRFQTQNVSTDQDETFQVPRVEGIPKMPPVFQRRSLQTLQGSPYQVFHAEQEEKQEENSSKV